MKITGPVNIIKIEGRNKSLYLFMDVHKKVKDQTECLTETIRVDQYLSSLFKKYHLDFFYEIQPAFLNVEKTGDRYIDKIFDLFIDKDNYPNVRFHYVDLRDYMMIHELFQIQSNINQLLMSILNKDKIDIDDLNLLKDGILLEEIRIRFFYELLYNGAYQESNLLTVNETLNFLQLYESDEYRKKIATLIYKLRYRYNFTDVQRIVNEILDTEIRDDFENLFEQIEYLIKVLNDAIFDLQTNVKMDINYLTSYSSELNNSCIDSYQKIVSKITDLYFARRFVDKVYVETAIVYAGVSHTLMYLYLLIKYFDFKITSYSYLKISKEEVMKKFKELKRFEVEIKNTKLDIYNYFLNRDKHGRIIQCSEIIFP